MTSSNIESTVSSNIYHEFKPILGHSWIDAWREDLPYCHQEISELPSQQGCGARSCTSSSGSSEIWFDESYRSRTFNDEPRIESISETTLESEWPITWETPIRAKNSLSNASETVYGFPTHRSSHTNHTNLSLPSASSVPNTYSKPSNLCSLCKKLPSSIGQISTSSQTCLTPHPYESISQNAGCISPDTHNDSSDPVLDTHSIHSKKSSGSSVKTNLYKTELCRNWEENGECRYGLKCQFAHGHSELRSLLRHPKYKTSPCKTFTEIGSCPYGQRCCFSHVKESVKSGNIDAIPSFENIIPSQTKLLLSQISSPIDLKKSSIKTIHTSPLFQKTRFNPELSELSHIFNSINL
ncbi:hypothetical protein PCK2_000949, partial [Pneumocystis canis]